MLTFVTLAGGSPRTRRALAAGVDAGCHAAAVRACAAEGQDAQYRADSLDMQ